MLRNAGVDVDHLAQGMTPRDGKPEFVIETDDPTTAQARATTQPVQSDQAAARAGLAPGAVPPSGGGLRRMLLIGIAIGLGWWVARALNLL